MITTTPSPIPERRRAGSGRRAFTLVEMMIGASLGAFIMLAVMTSFLFLGRSGANIQNYSDMESQARGALELFAEDVRQASAITWNSSVSCTLTVNSASIVYQYDSSARTFSRLSAGTTRALITGITTGSFAFKAYSVSGADLPLSTAAERTAATSSTKQLQISLEAMRQNTTVAAATNTVLSARFILRNKIVTA